MDKPGTDASRLSIWVYRTLTKSTLHASHIFEAVSYLFSPSFLALAPLTLSRLVFFLEPKREEERTPFQALAPVHYYDKGHSQATAVRK
jgi:hypothetical protein